ncbi:hypothetical protein [Nocardia sp. NPDC049526]
MTKTFGIIDSGNIGSAAARPAIATGRLICPAILGAAPPRAPH